jgi:uncharacterized repeat protein (TIGR01451 family)
VQAISANAVKLSLDLDPGVTGFERVVTLAWNDLTRPAGSDLRDSDHDGMHDSWELAYGLLPGTDDSSGDLDGDGASNLIEYLNGTNPNLVASKPQEASLQVTASALPSPTTTGTVVVYTMIVGNSSPFPARDVVLTDSLPAVGVAFVSTDTTQGSCSLTAASTVTCNLGTVSLGIPVTVRVLVNPTAFGTFTITNVATVTSSAFETNFADNTVSTPVTVN